MILSLNHSVIQSFCPEIILSQIMLSLNADAGHVRGRGSRHRG